MAETATAKAATPWGILLSTTIGLKVLMAASGAIWVGFVLGHMAGNLQVFLPMPADQIHPINKYAAMLKGTGGLLWVARAVLLGALVSHIVAAVQLGQRNRAARPVPYRERRTLATSLSSNYMRVSGFAILFFVLYHLAHFTAGITNPEHYDRHLANGMHDVYSMFVLGFRQPLIAGLYVIANVLLALHLHHAVSSIFQTLGLRTGGWRGVIDRTGPALAALVAVGNIAMPLAVLLGLIGGDVK